MTNPEDPKPLMESMDHLDPLVKDPKAVEDFSESANELIPRAESLAKSNRVQEAVESLLALEKRARFAFDGLTCSRILTTIASMYFQRGDLEGLFEIIPSLIKRRGQLKRPVADLINLCTKWLKEQVPDQATKYRFIAVLADVTEGKIFVEAERARIKLYESQLKEAEGKIDEACLILQEEQVEIIGSMDPREKTEYILDQMRLVLLRNDYIRLPIIAKKINPRILAGDKSLWDLKIRYYEFLILHYLHEEDYLEVSNCYKSVYETINITTEDSLKALTGCTLFLLLSPVNESQRTSITSLLEKEKRNFDSIVVIRDLARSFLGNSLISTQAAQSVRLVDFVFGESTLHADRCIASGQSRFDLLLKRICQFNLLCVLCKFYSRIRLARLAAILGLSVEATEVEITQLVTAKSLSVKIDRPAGIVWFHPRLSPQKKLDVWSANINKALDLVESASNLIQKEIQIHAAKERIRAQLAKDSTVAA
jgi:26S proteasome regulatory subunit N5